MNRRRSLLLVLMVLVLSTALAIPSGISAHVGTPSTRQESLALTDAKDLARFAPADSVFYANLRIDDEYLDLFDGLLNKIVSKLPANAVPPMLAQPGALRKLLTNALKNAGLDYQNDVRSWLGDRLGISVGAISALMSSAASPANAPVLAAIEIKDKAKAEAFIDALLERGKMSTFFKKTPGDAATTYLSAVPQLPIEISVSADALLIGTPASVSDAVSTNPKLNSAKTFTDVTALLTAPSYNILLFVNTPEILKVASSLALRNASPQQTKTLQDILNSIGAQAVGFTVLDGSSLVVETAQKVNDKAKLQSTGLLMPSGKGVNPAFDAVLPGNTAMLVRGTDLKGLFAALLANLQGAAAMQRNGQSGDAIKRGLDQITSLVMALSGLDLQKDILDTLTGDFALFVGYDALEPGAPSIFTSLVANALSNGKDRFEFKGIDAGFVTEVTDAAKSANIVAKLSETAKRLLASSKDIKVSEEQIGTGKAIVLSIASNSLVNTVDVVIGANDKVFVVATRAAATEILSGKGGFANTDAYKEAVKYFLPATNSVAYLNRNALNLVADLGAVSLGITSVFRASLMSTPSPSIPTPDPNLVQKLLEAYKQAQMVARQVTSIFNSASITSVIKESGDTLGRAVITLSK